MENVKRFHGDKLILFTRGGATYHARLLVGGQYIFKSTKCVDPYAAYAVADEWFQDYSYEFRHGRAINVQSFKELINRWSDEQRHALSEHRYLYITGTIRRYLIPYFGDVKLNMVTNGMMAGYWPWRIDYWNTPAGRQIVQAAKKRRWSLQHPKRNTLAIVAKTPSQSSLQHEQALLRQFWRWAKANELVRETPIIDAPKRAGRKPNRRPTFELHEWEQLQTFMQKWVMQERGLNGMTFFHRQLIKNYVNFLAGSGLRPGEARNLQWSDVEPIKDKDGVEQVLVHVRPENKTGARDVICLRDASTAILGMYWCNTRENPREYVFSNRDDVPIANLNPSFKTLLKKAGLHKDHFGQNRSVYSLRHFYASQRLMRGVPIDDLAQNMGTSVKMIVSHYSHLTVRMRAHIHGGSICTALG